MNLILISEFMQDEIYLNEEVKFYDDFDKVILFTVKGHVYSNNHLTIPDYIDVGKLDIHYNSNLNRIKYLLKGVFNIESFREFLYLIKSKKMSLSSLMRYLLFSSKSYLVYDNIKKRLNDFNLDKSESIVFYTYRIGPATFASYKLKKDYPNSKLVSRSHAQDIFEFRNKEEYLPYRSDLYKNIDEIYCISEDGKKYLENRYNSNHKNIFVYRLGTRDVGINTNITNNNFVIITCSRIARIKRLTIIAEALKCIEREDITWIHFGDGDDDYLNEVKNILNSCNRNIKFEFRGFVDNRVYLDLISNIPFSIFINVSESEGLPVSIMEVESVGAPVIATDVGGTSEAVVNGYNGILLEKDFSIADLKNSIIKFIYMDSEEFNKFRMNSRYMWESKFRLSKNYSEFKEHIKEL